MCVRLMLLELRRNAPFAQPISSEHGLYNANMVALLQR